MLQRPCLALTSWVEVDKLLEHVHFNIAWLSISYMYLFCNLLIHLKYIGRNRDYELITVMLMYNSQCFDIQIHHNTGLSVPSYSCLIVTVVGFFFATTPDKRHSFWESNLPLSHIQPRQPSVSLLHSQDSSSYGHRYNSPTERCKQQPRPQILQFLQVRPHGFC